jgi:hypothetical protein
MPINPPADSLGAILRAVTEPVTKEPLPADWAALLVLLQIAQEDTSKRSHRLPHWTSAREPKKS